MHLVCKITIKNLQRLSEYHQKNPGCVKFLSHTAGAKPVVASDFATVCVCQTAL